MSSLAQNRSYKLLFSATAISNLGDGVSALAFPWLATLITRDPLLIAFVAFATRLPWFLLSIPAGAIVDRYDRRVLMVNSDAVRMCLTAAVIVLILSVPAFPPPSGEGVYIILLSALAFLLGTAEVLRDNAAQTVLPQVVAKEQLETANGQLWSVEQVMGSFVGPPLAGVLIALAVPAPFLLDGLTFGVAAWLVWRMALPTREVPARRAMRVELAEGWQWMRSHPMVLRLAITLGVMNAVSMMALAMLVLVAQERLGLGPLGHGILLTAGAAGGVVGGLYGPRVIKRIGNTATLRWALVLFPLSMAVIALSANPYVVGAALFLETFAALLWNIVTVSWRQRIIPDDLLGRVNSLYRFFGWGLTPVGALLGGWLVSMATPSLGREVALQVPYVLAVVVFVCVAISGWRHLRL